jgi:hypothetical protein
MAAPVAREFGGAKSRARHGLILALCLLALGCWVLFLADDSIPDRQWIGLVAVALGLGFGFHASRVLRTTAVHLRIDERGVWFKDWDVTVPWRDVSGVYQTGNRLQPFITLRLAHPESFLKSLSGSAARKLRHGRLWKDPELRIPRGAVDASQRELLDLLRAGLKD